MQLSAALEEIAHKIASFKSILQGGHSKDSQEDEPTDPQVKKEELQRCPAWVLKKLRLEMKVRQQLEAEWEEQQEVNAA
jgi:hypothetical protein